MLKRAGSEFMQKIAKNNIPSNSFHNSFPKSSKSTKEIIAEYFWELNRRLMTATSLFMIPKSGICMHRESLIQCGVFPTATR